MDVTPVIKLQAKDLSLSSVLTLCHLVIRILILKQNSRHPYNNERLLPETLNVTFGSRAPIINGCYEAMQFLTSANDGFEASN
jgi:hypothetical protein